MQEPQKQKFQNWKPTFTFGGHKNTQDTLSDWHPERPL